MICQTEIDGRRYRFDPGNALDISIPLVFDGPQPNIYDVPGASAAAYEDGEFVGDTRRGGGCNFETYTLTPHCNGTHTECVGHISLARIAVNSDPPELLLPVTLISVAPVSARDSQESYRPPADARDALITAEALHDKLPANQTEFLQALAIRTLPNHASKKERRYSQASPPFFSLEAMTLLRSREVRHLLVDLPSVDRSFDEGRLSAHHIFWDVPAGSQEVDPDSRSLRTITEMFFVDDSIADGEYLLSLQMPNFTADAAPSRPLLIPLL